MLNKIAFKVALAGLMASLSSTSLALEDQWYLGIGGGISQLQPDLADMAIGVAEDNGHVATAFIGKDFDNRSSGQLQLYSLGEAEYSDGQSTAIYTAGDASLLYRFHDSRDRQPQGKTFGTAFYGRLGFGFMRRDSDASLDTDNPIYFGAGAGMETYLSYNLAMRLEALYHGTDVASATLTLVSRFGGRQRLPEVNTPVAHEPARPTDSMTSDTAVDSISVQENAVALPTDLPETYDVNVSAVPLIEAQPATTDDSPGFPGVNGNAVPSQPSISAAGADTTQVPEVEILGSTSETQVEPHNMMSSLTDSDADSVMDDRDQCPESTTGYPVNARGCPAFGGMLPDLTFNDRTADLARGSYEILDKLIQQLKDFPTTYIELVAHTDNRGSEAEQSELTRQRLRSIGVYVVRNGIHQERLLLRSYGGSRPAFNNSTTDGRRRNNRIEVFENP